MKLLVEFAPNPNSMTLHVDKRVTDSMIEMFDCPSRDSSTQPLYIKKIFNKIDGIEQIFLGQYHIHLLKGTIFNWNKLIPRIQEILQEYFVEAEDEIEMVYQANDIVNDIITESELRELLELIRNKVNSNPDEGEVLSEDVSVVFGEMESGSSELTEDDVILEEEEEEDEDNF